MRSSTRGSEGDLFIEGNGTKDEDLAATGLARAKGLVASSDSDVDNLYVTLSARGCAAGLFIVARASQGDVAEKLRRAGADRVVQPYVDSGPGDGGSRAEAAGGRSSSMR